MHISVKANIVPLLHHIVNAVKPFAKTKDIRLSVSESIKEDIIRHHPEMLGIGLFSLLCRIINYLPEKSTIFISIQSCEQQVKVLVEVPGINLCVNNITKDISLNVATEGEWNKRTLYTITLSRNIPAHNGQKNLTSNTTRPNVLRYFAEIRKRLQAHTEDKLVALTKIYNPGDAAFLQKINDIIFSNISNEYFDANLLSQQICLSRAQVFRKLKNITGMAPAGYIKHLRLQKAKKMLETTDKRVGEVAFETGFESTSNFTKVFTKKYGFNPSLLKRKPAQQIDKTMQH